MHKRSVRQVTPPTTRTISATRGFVPSGLIGTVRWPITEEYVLEWSYIKAAGIFSEDRNVGAGRWSRKEARGLFEKLSLTDPAYRNGGQGRGRTSSTLLSLSARSIGLKLCGAVRYRSSIRAGWIKKHQYQFTWQSANRACATVSSGTEVGSFGIGAVGRPRYLERI